GNTSFGMRLPFVQLPGNTAGLDDSQIGDLTIIFKWAFLNDRVTGDVACAGLVVTAPTGDSFLGAVGQELHSTLLQPYVGYIFNSDRMYVHGFTSLVVPTDPADVLLLLNDIGVGYKMLTNDPQRWFKGFVPTLEAHLLTPLTHRSAADPGHVPDWLS